MTQAPFADAMTAARLFARDPLGTGIHLRAAGGVGGERFVALLRGLLGGRPLRRCPGSVSEDRLWGGLDLPASLAAGRPVQASGLLAEADGGVVVIGGAERLSPELAARLGSVLDTGEAGGRPACIGLVLVDDGADEMPPPALLDRMMFRVSVDDRFAGEAETGWREKAVAADARALEGLCAIAAALGIGSARATLLALRAAKGLASVEGRDAVGEGDVIEAARLVLAHRATVLPAEDGENEAKDESGRDQAEGPDEESGEDQTPGEGGAVPETVLAAARAAVPAGLLATTAGRGRRQGRGAPWRGIGLRGRPTGARPGKPGGGARLALLDTLRAAAPWQRLRASRDGVLAVRASDLRVRRFAAKARTTTIFAVDASGSAALHRLAEAKGAVELLLAECYVRRDQVALLGFRGREAALLLPPTGALARARRCLAALPGGGGTPLASGLEAALLLAGRLRRQGEAPHLVLLTDGRANVARDGTADRRRALEQAQDAAAAIGAARLSSVVIDISPRPTGEAQALAARMGGRFVALPRGDAASLARAARAG